MPPDESSPAIPSGTHCEYCGLDYDDAERRETAKGHRTPPAVAHASSAVVDDDGVPLFTHCEYCGLEYPAPRPAPRREDRH